MLDPSLEPILWRSPPLEIFLPDHFLLVDNGVGPLLGLLPISIHTSIVASCKPLSFCSLSEIRNTKFPLFSLVIDVKKLFSSTDAAFFVIRSPLFFLSKDLRRRRRH